MYSAVISAVIYPIEAHWTWGGGWLAQMGFHDFAGSNCIHMVGGICALIGAYILGPRIGKFTKNKAGKITKVNAFPGHSLPLGCLGVFILWLGWYGFNGAAATSVAELGSIFVTTTIAPAVATVVCMIFTWLKYGKPDVSMCLNASLAGLVAITAPCDVCDAFGAIVIGAVAGVLVVFGVWLLDYKLHIDDPVGAVAVPLPERHLGHPGRRPLRHRNSPPLLQEAMATVSLSAPTRLQVKACSTAVDSISWACSSSVCCPPLLGLPSPSPLCS